MVRIVRQLEQTVATDPSDGSHVWASDKGVRRVARCDGLEMPPGSDISNQHGLETQFGSVTAGRSDATQSASDLALLQGYSRRPMAAPEPETVLETEAYGGFAERNDFMTR